MNGGLQPQVLCGDLMALGTELRFFSSQKFTILAAVRYMAVRALTILDRTMNTLLPDGLPQFFVATQAKLVDLLFDQARVLSGVNDVACIAFALLKGKMNIGLAEFLLQLRMAFIAEVRDFT